MLFTSQEAHMIADSASQSSKSTENDFIEAASYNRADAASVTSSHINDISKQKNLPRDSVPVSDLHAQGNGEANECGEVEKDSFGAPREACKSANENEKEETYVVRPDSLDPPVKYVPCDDCESDAMEQDVKVCDICGDTGREHLLAVCSWCADGAEHTYCMREMLQKVPESGWLCEECKFANKNAVQNSGFGFEGKNSVKAMQVLGKRPVEKIGVECIMKKQALDVNAGSPRIGNGTTASSLRSSLNMEKQKGSIAHEFSEIPRPPNASRIQVFKNALLSSKSFSSLNAKLKVKQAEDGFLQKPREAHRVSLLDTKIGSLRTLGKSTSFKYVNRKGPDSPDSKVKIIPAKFSSVQELKEGSREKNEQDLADRNRLPRVVQDCYVASRSNSTSYISKLDQKLSSLSETHSLSSASDSQDSNFVQSDGKLGSSLPKSASYVAHQGTDAAIGSGGSSSSDGGCNISIKKRSNHTVPKSGMLLGLSWSSEKQYNSRTGNSHDALNHAGGSRNHVEIIQESYSGRLGKGVTSGSRTAHCEKCDESGHTTELCSRGGSQACEIDVSVDKIVCGDTDYGSRSTAAVTSAMLKKPGIYRRNKAMDKSDRLSIVHARVTREKPTFQDILKKSENMMQLNGLNEAADSLKAVVSQAKLKPLLRDVSALWKASIIPEHECIWQGGFQVQRGSKQMDLHGGIQAHLPTCVSSMVLEMVNKFPNKIALNEVPRVSTWPIQFRDCGTKEHHIALYFFAQDVESYERNYMGLLENMMKSDLALRGDLGTTELLIFPSNQLPKKSQRWNMAFYLWGVFKGSRTNGSDHGVGEQESFSKKQEADNGGTNGCNISINSKLFRDGFACQVHNLNDCLAVAENLRSEDYSDGVKVKGMETAERYLFPVSSQGWQEFRTEYSPIPWKSVSSPALRPDVPVPDLELALGAETKSPRKGFSFWVDQSKCSSPDTLAPASKKNREDERSASLSLSLSFPFPTNE